MQGCWSAFCGGGGTPLFAGAEIEWLTPQSEYRPTEYVQGWLSFWFDEAKRLEVAKSLQLQRLAFLQQVWRKDKDLQQAGFGSEDAVLQRGFQSFEAAIARSQKVSDLLLNEAALTKKLYQFAAQTCRIQDFNRLHENGDLANQFLSHGNYLAYGLAACTLWTLGIPHGFAVMHGKTRRGALVFDVADLVKDAIVLPMAFMCASENASEQEFRQQVLQKFTEHKALDFMFDVVKQSSLQAAWGASV